MLLSTILAIVGIQIALALPIPIPLPWMYSSLGYSNSLHTDPGSNGPTPYIEITQPYNGQANPPIRTDGNVGHPYTPAIPANMNANPLVEAVPAVIAKPPIKATRGTKEGKKRELD
ncbi:hypothetical protein ABW19_dt0202657 [Dactylella cylindrospora]|nr:hypothetical protein ABW19_dt0202657 [Dactylella cylindrospora]